MDARPDKEDMEEAIEHFLSGLEKQEERGFRDLHRLHRLLSELPMPQPAARRSLSVSEAIEAGFLPKQDEGVVDMFTPSELRLYRHAQDHRLRMIGTHIFEDIPCYPFNSLRYPMLSYF